MTRLIELGNVHTLRFYSRVYSYSNKISLLIYVFQALHRCEQYPSNYHSANSRKSATINAQERRSNVNLGVFQRFVAGVSAFCIFDILAQKANTLCPAVSDWNTAVKRQVLAHFNGNLVVVPIVYGFERLQAHAVQAYGQVTGI